MFALAAADGGLPQNIVRTFPTDASAAALDAELACLAPRAVFAVDPQELPAALVAAMRRRGWLDRVVLARSLQSTGHWPLDPLPGQIMVPTIRMAKQVAAAIPGVNLRTLALSPRSTAMDRPARRMLLIETPVDEDAARACREAVLREGRERRSAYGVCLLGEPPDALQLMAEGLVFATGEMPADDLDAWLARSQAAALFLNSTGFGASDPRLDDWLAAGMNVAILTPGGGADRDGSLLELDSASAPCDMARQLWNWVEMRSLGSAAS